MYDGRVNDEGSERRYDSRFFFLNKHTRKIILWRVWLTGPDGAQHEPGSRAVGTARDKINKSVAAESLRSRRHSN